MSGVTLQPAVYRPTRSWRQQIADALWCAWVKGHHWIAEWEWAGTIVLKWYDRIDAWKQDSAA